MSLAKGQLIETISLQEALKLFELPRKVGEYEGEEIICAVGRFGPYIKFKGGFISIGKLNDPYTIDIETCIELIKNHAQKEAAKYIKNFPEEGIEILNGRFGAYIKYKGKNIKIPKGTNPAELDVEGAMAIIQSSKPKK